MSTHRQRPFLIIVFAVLHALCTSSGSALAARADEPGPAADPIKARLDKAKADHQERIDAIKKVVLKAIEQKLAAVRKSKNKTNVDTLLAETEAFKKNVNAVPGSLRDAAAYRRRLNAVHRDLDGAYKRAIEDYTAAGKDAEATALQKEQEAFRLKSASVIPYHREEPVDPPVEQVAVPPALRLDPKILVRSSWNFVIRGNVTAQRGAFRIVDGVIRHLDTEEAVGSAAIAGPGEIHLVFWAHRKIPGGEAHVAKIANGEFRGQLNYQFGEYAFEMNRR